MVEKVVEQGCVEVATSSVVEQWRCRVVEVKALTVDLFTLRVRPARPVSAAPGQFAMLRMASQRLHPLLGRPMSILEAGEDLRFLIRRCGQGTKLLTSMLPGDEVAVLGPSGRGWGEPRSDAALVLVAGGVGLAPLLFAAREHAAIGRRPRLLYGARARSELVLLDEAAKATTLEISTDDGSHGHHGLVVDLLDAALRSAEGSLEVWTCGPEPMMEAVAQRAWANGVPCKVSVEARMACGRGLCLGCARIDARGVPKYVCSDGPVFGSEEIYEFGSDRLPGGRAQEADGG